MRKAQEESKEGAKGVLDEELGGVPDVIDLEEKKIMDDARKVQDASSATNAGKLHDPMEMETRGRDPMEVN